ncbi:MAG TPA: L-carnitine dehydrogenase, partial [Thalassospira sp.]|nr:L-carnitine dehydrogenase [Thalassospira sp.]
FHDDMAGAVAGAQWIQESVPEQLALKHKILAQIQAHAPSDCLIGS